jgi:hypothetical protein
MIFLETISAWWTSLVNWELILENNFWIFNFIELLEDMYNG